METAKELWGIFISRSIRVCCGAIFGVAAAALIGGVLGLFTGGVDEFVYDPRHLPYLTLLAGAYGGSKVTDLMRN